MSYEDLIEQTKLLQRVYPALNLIEHSNEILIQGDLTFNAEFDNVPIVDTYSIKICILNSFPLAVPHVWETAKRIPKRFIHFLEDGSFCLGIEAEIRLQLLNNPTLLFFVNRFVVNYLYAASYYNKYNTMPFGERSHYEKGIFEFYREYFQVQTDKQVLLMLKAITAKNFKYRGHLLCPCDSGKKLRKCCHNELLRKISASNIGSLFLDDYKSLPKREL